MIDGDSPGKGIQAVEIAVRILGCLAERRTMALRQLAAASGLSPSNLRFYLISLLRTGLVVQEPTSGLYGLGPSTIHLGLAALSQFDVVHAARGMLHRLADDLGFTAFLSVWGPGGAVAIDRVDGRVRTVLEIRVGTIFPLLTSAVGRCFVATLPPAVAKRAVALEAKVGAAGSSKDRAGELLRLRSSFRADGMVRARGTVLADFTAIAVPILDNAALPLAVLSLVGPVDALDDSASGQPASILKQNCSTLSGQLGWRLP